MRISKWVLAAGALTLAACGASQGEKTGEGPAKSGLYDFTMPNGTKGTLVFKKGGEYAQMVDNQPKPIEEGVWRRRDNLLCLDDDKNDGESCFEERAVGSEGDFSLTAPGGEPIVFTVRVLAP